MRFLCLAVSMVVLLVWGCANDSTGEEVIVAPMPELEEEVPFEAGTVAIFKCEKQDANGEFSYMRLFFGNDPGVLDSIHYFTSKQSRPRSVELFEQTLVEDDEELFIEGALRLPGDTTLYDFGVLPDRLYLVLSDSSYLDFIYHE